MPLTVASGDDTSSDGDVGRCEPHAFHHAFLLFSLLFFCVLKFNVVVTPLTCAVLCCAVLLRVVFACSSANVSRSQSPDMPPPLQTLLASDKKEPAARTTIGAQSEAPRNAANTNASQQTAAPASVVAQASSDGEAENENATAAIVATDTQENNLRQTSSPPMTPTKDEEGSSARTPNMTERIDINVVDDSYQVSHQRVTEWAQFAVDAL